MASVLLMSISGDGIPLALRMANEGHIVKVSIKEKHAKQSLYGFRNPSLVSAPKMLDQYDLVLYDMAGLGQQADQMKKSGRFVMGGGMFNDKLELDRAYGEKVARKLLKVQVPDQGKVYTSGTTVLNALNKAKKPMVLKPMNNKAPGLTLVSEDEENRTLKSLVKNQASMVLPTILQERIDGVEISTEGWFNGEEFCCFNHTVEHKRLMEGDKGPLTGCMGNTVWVTKVEDDEIVKRVLLPLAPLLKKVDYLGPIDVNCICTEKDIWFLEFTPRFGYDATQALTELMYSNLFDFLWQIAGQDSISMKEDWSIAVRLSMAPYPNKGQQELKLLKGLQVLDVPKPARKHVMLSDVMKQDDVEVLAGVDGVVGCVTARGTDIKEARRRAYRTVANISIHPDLQYRKDIGLGAEQKIEQLKTWGWINA